MIYITGDIHGSISVASRFNSRNFPEGRALTKQDYVIIVGDFGLLWADDAEDRFWLKWLTEKPWTTLFIDGNHENFDLLESYPVSEWNGGQVHHITPSIIHLMRGQVFEIGGKSFSPLAGRLLMTRSTGRLACPGGNAKCQAPKSTRKAHAIWRRTSGRLTMY